MITHGSADPEILAEGDEAFTYLSNGDDAFAIVDASSGLVIDIIGDRGPDPGDAGGRRNIRCHKRSYTCS